MSDPRDCVSEADIKKTIQVLYGPHAELIDYQVAPASSVVLGFASLILRVTANVKISKDCDGSTISFIAKCLPVASAQLKIMNENDLFHREVLYFQEARPLLRGADLPIVRCVRAQPGLIMLEDLTSQGFRMLTHDMSDLSSNVLHYPHLKMIMEKLAQIHAASLDQNWLHILPYLKQDSFLELPSPFPSMFKRACNAYASAMSEYYPNIDSKYSEWLRSSRPLQLLLALDKSDESKNLLVLTHGDFWVNNILFKLDPGSNLPVDLKFIDFQMCRYVPPSRDILRLLYASFNNSKVRNEFESSLLQTYVSSFNCALGYERLRLEHFLREFESSRLFGLGVGLVYGTMNFMPQLYPKEDEEMTNEAFTNITSGDQFANLLQNCSKNAMFEEYVKDLLLQIINVYNTLDRQQ